MQELWTAYGFYLWIFTTALVIIALVWLAWNTFGPAPVSEAESGDEVDVIEIRGLNELEAQVGQITEAMPYVQATLGRVMQFYGLQKFTDPVGAQAFALAVASGRGDGFLLASSVRGGVTVKPLTDWKSSQPLSADEQAAIDQAQAQKVRGA
jgi:hypothetical protein